MYGSRKSVKFNIRSIMCVRTRMIDFFSVCLPCVGVDALYLLLMTESGKSTHISNIAGKVLKL